MQTARVTNWNARQPDVMKIADRLDSGTAPELETDVRLFLVSGTTELTLDCAGLTYMSSVGLQSVIMMAKEMQKIGGKLSISNLQGQPKDIFDACRCSEMIPDAGKVEPIPFKIVA
jgi:anti-anti-sigma factor